MKVEVPGETRWTGCGVLSGAYEPACCQAYVESLKRSLRLRHAYSVCQRVPPLETLFSRDVLYPASASTQDPKDVLTSDLLSPAEKEKLDKEIEDLSRKMDALWNERADRKEWDSVKADLAVYQYSGQNVTEDPRRVDSYRGEVVKELGFGENWKEKRPFLNEFDVAACREVLARKSGAFWLEGSPRTTVRNVMHDCVPSGPPVSSQPHNLKGEAASWVDEKLEEEVRRGQLVRGASPWGSPPFPTREASSHKKHRKRRLVVDYRRVNSRVVRSTYYCRRASDVVSSASGSIWYSFVDAVTGFNQIKNTRRAMEVLAIVARSGKFLPVCLTFGPVNGPDDFCFVVDRAYAPGRGRKLRYTREWVAYVDDLTVRTGRVVDGRYLTDDQAEAEVRAACKKGPVEAVQPAEEALKALGVGLGPEGSKAAQVPKKNKHDEVMSDHNHPTRKGSCHMMKLKLGLFKLFLVSNMLCVNCCFPQLFGPRWLKLSAGLAATGVSEVRAKWCALAGEMPRRNQEKKKYWEDAKEMQFAMGQAYRHGAHQHRGQLTRGGWIEMKSSAEIFGVPVSHLYDALRLDGSHGKRRFEFSKGWIRCSQGHSAKSGLRDPSDIYEVATRESLAAAGLTPTSKLFHGTDAERVEGIVRFGLLPGGGSTENRLTVHWVAGTAPPSQASVNGFRTGSTALVETRIQRLWDCGLQVFHGSDRCYLSKEVPPEALNKVWLANDEGVYVNLVADFDETERVLKPSG